MPRKMRVTLALLLAALAVLAAARGLLFPTAELSQSDLQLHAPIERPFELIIGCDVHKESGWALYGGDAPIGAFFVGCKPQGNFYNLVLAPSTPEEACESKTQPEVAFLLTASGDVKNVALTRSSGSASVDRRVLETVRDSRYPPTNCGACTVVARVPVDLKCNDSRR